MYLYINIDLLMVDLYSNFEEIQNFLSIQDEFFDLENIIEEKFPSDEDQMKLLEKILNFIYLFKMFKSIKPFMRSIYKCIQKTLDLKAESIGEYESLLISTTLYRLLREYITYSKIAQKNRVLEYLAESLERLELQPMIINLGLIVKPIYLDLNYVKQIEVLEEVEISYILGNKEDIEIKEKIDKWSSKQSLNLDQQELLKEQLKKEFERVISKYDIPPESKRYKKLLNEAIEMLTLKFTVLSLMDSFANDVAPVPIK